MNIISMKWLSSIIDSKVRLLMKLRSRFLIFLTLRNEEYLSLNGKMIPVSDMR